MIENDYTKRGAGILKFVENLNCFYNLKKNVFICIKGISITYTYTVL